MNNLKLVTLLLLTITFNYLFKEILNLDSLIISSITEELTNDQIQGFINFQRQWEWLSYIITPTLVLIKIIIIAGILDIGCFFFDIKIKYKKLFRIVVNGEYIFLLVAIFKTIWFLTFQTDYTLEDIQNFYPLSALNIVDYRGLETWFIYPFQVLNLFEVAYWFILAYLIGKEINDTTEKGLLIVASSYGTGLLIWVIGTMFLILNMS
ncbi:hypothetical protein [Tenacibaculum caenipelagi]|uniref:Yip1 domain-containing protein n=1 Tax=Tenacibaculum caenipelagi TaxID=1325435 RepID=A0A4V3D321_9FLAO|nr:hypothetical protein [Tenacibaculum caenipelagi]TDQ27504.1 hypothetical protein DFQ07_1355 [Tenacibaculum caenipelagi]